MMLRQQEIYFTGNGTRSIDTTKGKSAVTPHTKFQDFGFEEDYQLHRKDTSLGESSSISCVSKEPEPNFSLSNELSCPVLPLRKSISKPKQLKKKCSVRLKKMEKRKKKFLRPRADAETIILKNSKTFVKTTKNRNLEWEKVTQNAKVKRRIFLARLDNAFDIQNVEIMPFKSLKNKIDIDLLNKSSSFSTFPVNLGSFLDLPMDNMENKETDKSVRAREHANTAFSNVLEQVIRSKLVNVEGFYAASEVFLKSRQIFLGETR